MKVDAYSFNRRAVRPMACLREGWQIIKPDYWLFVGIVLVGMLIGGMAAMFLMGPIMCGIHLCLFRQERGRMVTFSMLFKGFEYFVPSLIATLIKTVPTIILVMLVYGMFVAGVFGTFALIGDQPRGVRADAAIGNIMLSLSGLYIYSLFAITMVIEALFFFIYPLIVDRKLSGPQAVKLSIKAFLANFWGVIALIMLMQIIYFFGFLFCFVGIYLVFPLTIAMVSVAYAQVFGDDEGDEIEQDVEMPTRTLPINGPTETGIQTKDNANDRMPGEP